MTQLNPYIGFKDNAREAMEFYKSVFGGELTINTYKDFGASQGPAQDDKVMHSMLKSETGIVFMATDILDRMEYQPGMNISMSLSGDDEAELRRYWDGLAAGATIDQPLTQAPWGDTFGMLTDKFGVHWMVNITGKKT